MKRKKEPQAHRASFWNYCVRTAGAAAARARAKNVPCTIDAYLIDRLLVDQQFCCAVCKLPLWPPNEMGRQFRKDPFGPSLDRIVPELGYIPGNVRVVNNLVNSAMQEWGLESLMIVVDAMMSGRNGIETAAGKVAAKSLRIGC